MDRSASWIYLRYSMFRSGRRLMDNKNKEVVDSIEAPIYLKYNFTAGFAPARFLSQLKQGVLQANVVQNVIMFMFLPEDHVLRVVLPPRKKLYWAIKLRCSLSPSYQYQYHANQ